MNRKGLRDDGIGVLNSVWRKQMEQWLIFGGGWI